MPKIISMKQLREHFAPIKKGLRRGDSYLLMYRSKPLATLIPYKEKSPYKQSVFNLQTKFTPNSVASTPNLIAETKSDFAEALKQLQTAAKKTPAIPTGNQTWQNLNKTIAHAQTKSQARHNKISANTTRVTTSKPRTNLNKIRKILAP